MNKIAFLYGAETRRLKKIIHKTRDRDLCRRANAVLLVLKGKTKSEVASLLQAGRSSLNRWLKWYDVAGVDGLKTKGVGRPVRQNRDFICGVLKILLKYTPRTLGYQRSRWSTELFALLLNKLCNIQIHSSTIRRWLPKAGIVWRRAAPTLYIQDPDKKEKLAAIREALADNSVDHPVFYQDEVDIHLNPKIGADWGLRGEQRKVATPGQNKKHYLAGALHGQTGQIVYVGGERKTSDLFIELLEKLKGQYRRAKRGRLRKRKIKHAKPLLTQMFDCSWHFRHGNCNCPTLAKCRTPLQIESQNTSRANQPSAVLTATARTHAFPPVEYGPPAAC
ncbi:IS630 family transposase [Shewanella sp. SM101]|nr:IS630 family transposase [Shewanella sp. SM101]